MNEETSTMRERTRQKLLGAQMAITLTKANELVADSRYRSWCGCLSGDDWSGVRVCVLTVSDYEQPPIQRWKQVSGGEHQQNDAPTGYETRGTHTTHATERLAIGDMIRIVARYRSRSTRRDLVVV